MKPKARRTRSTRWSRKALLFSLTTMMVAMAVPAAAYYWSKPSGDPFEDTLGAFNFRRINPPSNLMTVGSLYLVDPAGRGFTTICPADKADLEGHVIVSPSWDLQEEVERKGGFGITVDLRALLKSDTAENYSQTVHVSFTDVVLEEIPLDQNELTYSRMMEKPECSKSATRLVNAGEYVCQGQKTLKATVEFRIDRDLQRKLETEAKLTPDEIKQLIRQELAAHAHEIVTAREGWVFAGKALTHGIEMNPTCMSPATGRFRRTLPHTTFDRLVNFVLFRIIEPLFPAAPGEADENNDLPPAVASL